MTQPRLATQHVCPTCGNAHYPELVPQISAGDAGCEFCERPPGALTVDEYDELLEVGAALAAYDFKAPVIPGMPPRDTGAMRSDPGA
jgi:hypothetical protein